MLQHKEPNTNFGRTLEEHLMPSVERLLSLRDSIFQSLRVAAPAVVTAFDPGPPATVSVVIAITERVLRNTDRNAMKPTTEPMTLPLLQDVPVVVMGAGGWAMTFPIKPGDECLLVFMDTALDNWFQNGAPLEGKGVQAQPQMSQRRHSLSDAIAIFGLRSTPRSLPDYSTDAVQVRNNDGTVAVSLTDDGEMRLEAAGSSIVLNNDGSIQITAATGQVVVESSLLVKNGDTGTFTSSDNRVVTVQDGVVTKIT